MKYLCLLYRQEQRLAAYAAALEPNPKPGCDSTFADDASVLCGHRLAGNDATAEIRVVEDTLQVRGVSMPDGQELDGFVLIEARDLNDAIRIASRLPEAYMGYIEICPVRDD